LNRSLSQEAKKMKTDQNKHKLTIGEVARNVGLRTSAIRYYERKGLLESPQRSSGQRRYAVEVVQTIKLIQWGRQAGLGIRDLQILIGNFRSEATARDRWQQIIPPKLDEINAMLKRLSIAKTMLESTLNCTCPTIEDCATALTP
jgi:MerR family transcriptional regulator, redox-sensitive transcriptional activator SoxR